MSKEIKGYPHKQPFNIKGKECKSKKNTRWNPNSSTYWKKTHGK